jgi:FtsZ-binding cell division protein ZapB
MTEMDASTARDMIEDLQLEIAQLRERIRQLEAERDQWQTKAVSRD